MLSIIGLLLPLITSVVAKIIPDAGQAAQVQLEIQKAVFERQGEIDKAFAEAAKAQADVNLAEAGSTSLFVSGWRPAVGWVCAVACGYIFIVQPVFTWLVTALGGEALPSLDSNALMALITGMLGLGSLRTYEKVSGKK